MTDAIRRIWAGIAPIIGMVVFIALFIFGLFVFSYLLIIGAIIGLGLFIYAFIRAKLSRRKNATHPYSHGRTIDHNAAEEKESSSRTDPDQN